MMCDVTEAQARVLVKALDGSFVMIFGAFSDEGERGFERDMERFDRRRHIDRLINFGLLEPGCGFNQYVLTDCGRIVAQREKSRTEARRAKSPQRMQEDPSRLPSQFAR